MKSIIKIELQKIKSYTGFWIISSIIIGLFIFTAVISGLFDIKFITEQTINEIDIKNYFRFPYIWNTFTWLVKWFSRLLALVIIILIGNEFNYRTFKQHLVDGLSRNQLLFGKFFIVLILTLVMFFTTSIIILAFGLSFTENLTFSLIIENSYFIFTSFLEAIAYMSLAMLVVLLLKNTALSIIVYLAYFLFEGLLRLIFRIIGFADTISYFPIKVFSNLTPYTKLSVALSPEFQGQADAIKNPFDIGISYEFNVVLAIIYISLFIGLSFLIIKKKDF